MLKACLFNSRISIYVERWRFVECYSRRVCWLAGGCACEPRRADRESVVDTEQPGRLTKKVGRHNRKVWMLFSGTMSEPSERERNRGKHYRHTHTHTHTCVNRLTVARVRARTWHAGIIKAFLLSAFYIWSVVSSFKGQRRWHTAPKMRIRSGEDDDGEFLNGFGRSAN